jgi:uncharacterized protein (TIGR04255 family)
LYCWVRPIETFLHDLTNDIRRLQTLAAATMWKLLNDRNAIEVMAIQLRFSEALGSVAAKRVESDLASSANRAGLIDRIPIQGFQLNIANPGEVRQVLGPAMLYQSSSIVRGDDGAVAKVLSAQVEFQPTHVSYHSWRYSGWTQEKSKPLDILLKPLARALSGVALAAVRLEYLDRFYFDGLPINADPKSVLDPGSGWIAKHVFDTPNLWHSHTGRFDDVTESRRTLHMVNADFQDLTGPLPKLAGRRALQLVTASEYQFPDAGFDAGDNEPSDFLGDWLDELHTSTKAIFRSTISAEMRERLDLE